MLSQQEQNTKYKLTVGTFASHRIVRHVPQCGGELQLRMSPVMYTAEAGTTISRWTPDIQNYRLRKVWGLLGCTTILGLVFGVSIPGN